MKEYLFYVRKYNIFANDYLLTVYRCKTNDPLHTMGEMIYRTFEEIKRIDFVENSPGREKYWEEHNEKIHEWTDKYKIGDL